MNNTVNIQFSNILCNECSYCPIQCTQLNLFSKHMLLFQCIFIYGYLSVALSINDMR